MTILIVGGGKVGFYLARTLIEHGHKPRIVETDKKICARIANELDIPVYHGDGTTIEVLEHAGIREADSFVSVTGKDENNLIACQLAKREFHMIRTIARVNNPKNMEVMRQLGVDMPVSSTDYIARLLEREVDSAAIRQIVPLNGGEASINEFVLPENFGHHGIRLTDLTLPDECVIVSIMRNEAFIIPRGNTQIFRNDKLIIVCANDVVHELGKTFGIE